MPTKSSRVTFRKTTVTEALASGLEDLAARHCAEVEPFQDRFPINIDWLVYLAEERRGMLKTMGAWNNGDMVGYAAYLVHEPTHRKGSVWADNRGLFIAPEFRGHGPELMAHGEQMMRDLGVGAIRVDIKVANSTRNKRHANLEAVMARMGFSPLDRVFLKVL